MKSLIALTSVTSAKRVERLGIEHGITCRTVHTPKSLVGYGCSHSVEVECDYLKEIYLIARNMGLKIYGVYNKKSINGKILYEKVDGYDLS